MGEVLLALLTWAAIIGGLGWWHARGVALRGRRRTAAPVGCVWKHSHFPSQTLNTNHEVYTLNPIKALGHLPSAIQISFGMSLLLVT